MNWDAVGAISELAAAAGVVASLIYLARQIRQSNATDKLTATLGIQTSFNDVTRFLIDNEGTFAVLGDFENPDRDEQYRLSAKLYALYGHIELVYSHHQKGMIDGDQAKRTYSLLYWYRDRYGVKQWWELIGRDRFSSAFVAFVEGPEITP